MVVILRLIVVEPTRMILPQPVVAVGEAGLWNFILYLQTEAPNCRPA